MTTILIAEDSHCQRELIKEMLKSHQFRVLTAKNGQEALAQIVCNQPDLIILDIVMPLMNGYEVCRTLKKSDIYQSIPVILCSSQGSQSDRYWGLKQGADAYIAKPFKPEELLDAIAVLLTEKKRHHGDRTMYV